jgi:hypothetical protein
MPTIAVASNEEPHLLCHPDRARHRGRAPARADGDHRYKREPLGELAIRLWVGIRATIGLAEAPRLGSSNREQIGPLPALPTR